MNALFRTLLGLSLGGDVNPISPDSSKPSADKFNPESPLTFDETLGQLNRGYENTQRVIQFMDAKAGAVVALSLAIFTFAGNLVAWAYDKTDVASLHALPVWSKWAAFTFGVAIVFGGFCSLTYAFLTVRPNPLPNWGAFSTLFPAHGKSEEARARAYLQPMLEGANRGFPIREFVECQLIPVGQIVSKKINWLRVAIQWLWLQGLASVLMSGLVAGLAWSGFLVKVKEPTALEKAAVTASSESPKGQATR